MRKNIETKTLTEVMVGERASYCNKSRHLVRLAFDTGCFCFVATGLRASSSQRRNQSAGRSILQVCIDFPPPLTHCCLSIS